MTKNLKLYFTLNGSEEPIIIELPKIVTELFVNYGDTKSTLNIASTTNQTQATTEELGFTNLKLIWDTFRTIPNEKIQKIDIYLNEYLAYSISGIEKMSYSIEFLGEMSGEKIGIFFKE